MGRGYIYKENKCGKNTTRGGSYTRGVITWGKDYMGKGLYGEGTTWGRNYVGKGLHGEEITRGRNDIEEATI